MRAEDGEREQLKFNMTVKRLVLETLNASDALTTTGHF